MAVVSIMLVVIAALLVLFWRFFSRDFGYWTKRGITSCNPFSLFGERMGIPFTFKKFWEALDPMYKKYKDKRVVGTFQFKRPLLLVMDPELIKLVLTKDFSAFLGRGNPVDEAADPLFSTNLFNLEGPRWKNLRSRMSPTFTSGKLKLMFPLMADISAKFNEHIKDKAAKKEEIEFKEVLVRYATDIIGTVAFGIDCNSLKGDNKFYEMSKELFRASFTNILRFIFIFLHPVFMKIFTFKRIFRQTSDFFLKLMKDTVEYREKNKVERNDFVNLMMQLRDADKTETDRTNHIEFTHEVMTAQAFLFFLAGLENIANTVGFSLLELAIDPELQARAAEEVRECMDKHGSMTYEALKSMGLIERIIRETLRKWTPVGVLTRQSNGTYKFPDMDLEIDRTAAVWIPVWQLHHDPEYFPEPERFDPDRFTEEAKEQRHPYVYLPFGEGPRFCIAERFAILEMKLCLAALLSKYQFNVGEKTDVTFELDPKVFAPSPKKGFWLSVEERP